MRQTETKQAGAENAALTDKAALIGKAASFPYIIWDIDGTILDSMPYWLSLGEDYLRAEGITPPADLRKTIESMTLQESAEYFQKELGMDLSVPEIIRGCVGLIEEEYRTQIPAKKFASEIIRQAAARGSRMCVLTTSDHDLVEAALKRVGLLQYFEKVLTAGELGMDKRSGAIFETAMEQLGFEPGQTLICEDAPYAIRGAAEAREKFRDAAEARDKDSSQAGPKQTAAQDREIGTAQAGPRILAFRDIANTGDWPEICRIADLAEPGPEEADR